jgi:L-ascorbate metabolism protein UlaG (beta-lactamase superfamily)
MDAKEATEAVKLLNPNMVIPMHYRALPVLTRSADEFAKMLDKNSKSKSCHIEPL